MHILLNWYISNGRNFLEELWTNKFIIAFHLIVEKCIINYCHWHLHWQNKQHKSVTAECGWSYYIKLGGNYHSWNSSLCPLVVLKVEAGFSHIKAQRCMFLIVTHIIPIPNVCLFYRMVSNNGPQYLAFLG